MKAKVYLYTGVALGLLAGLAAAYGQEVPDAAADAQRTHPALLIPGAPQNVTNPAPLAQAQQLPVIPIPRAEPATAAAATGTAQAPAAGAQPPTLTNMEAAAIEVPSIAMSPAVRTLLDFKPSDVRFDVSELMDILRDHRHEGWVLAAYPDPKTGQPLIGAGFSLDLPERAHEQRDPLNPHPFLEPSSAELWQASGLDPAKLKNILDEFYARQEEWSNRTFRRHLPSLDPQITDEDANALLRIGIIQAIDNAKAYCRNFDRLSASQQMAMTQLVYQMGVNLEEFSSFLTLINRDDGNGAGEQAIAKADAEYWRSVQLSLVQSQWARLYRDRAKAVIAMLDPRYIDDPAGAEHSIGAILRPARRHRGHGAGLRTAAYARHRGSAAGRRKARARKD